jgi:hypothetical protein
MHRKRPLYEVEGKRRRRGWNFNERVTKREGGETRKQEERNKDCLGRGLYIKPRFSLKEFKI